MPTCPSEGTAMQAQPQRLQKDMPLQQDVHASSYCPLQQDRGQLSLSQEKHSPILHTLQSSWWLCRNLE